jgi:hypothetical protein
MTKRTWLFLFFLAAYRVVVGQSIKPDEVLIQLELGADIETMLDRMEQSANRVVLEWKSIAPRWRIYKVQLEPVGPREADPAQLQKWRALPGIRLAQWNHEVEERDVVPNDEYWIEQRDMGLIGMKKAWENTTGGLTPAGDTIVVAVLEKGMQKEHPDLIPNWWRNYKEVPDNGLDDDNNGYIDDYIGWDAAGVGDGNGTGSSHGTSVCGIVGARGNNGFGVTGVNWNVQIMPFVNVRFEDEIVGAYYYASEMRRLYNSTQGQQGAFVVSTNASFGIDNVFPEDYPLWCAVYDSLGAVGIISVGATANADRNVDEAGDMPTTCGSEFLVTVTNVEVNTGRRVVNAGYGATSIDLGSPGQGTFTTTNRVVTSTDTTWCGSFGGTSAACPHASGALALLYSVKCDGFVADALTQPVDCARRVRDLLLESVTPEPTLEGLTTTGGRLEVSVAVEEIMELCSGITGPLDVLDLRPNPVRSLLEIRYQTPDYSDDYVFRVYNMLGQLMMARDQYGVIRTDLDFTPPSFESKRVLLDVQQWPAGTYVLLLGKGKAMVQKKFVKI